MNKRVWMPRALRFLQGGMAHSDLPGGRPVFVFSWHTWEHIKRNDARLQNEKMVGFPDGTTDGRSGWMRSSTARL
jgi:hypothetical protein